LVTFWLHALSRLRTNGLDNFKEIPVEFKEFFDSIIRDTSYAAEIGRVLIASQLYFLFTLDKVWVIQNVFPLFKFSVEHRRAIQAWHGYLVWGRWNEDMLPYLMPCFEEAFPKVHSSFSIRQKESFCSFLAGIACHGSIERNQNGWLKPFLELIDGEERVMWAHAMTTVLKGMKELAIENAWTTWIRQYWVNRTNGIPAPLESAETEAMIHWCIYLKASFPESLTLLATSPAPRREQSFLLYELSGAGLTFHQPQAVADFVLYLLENRLIPAYSFDYILKIMDELRSTTASRGSLAQICDDLAELGYPGATDLKKSILEP
jgi:hypothetical protein